jgi:ribosome-binding protein aMBF1 (putative translation factor)
MIARQAVDAPAGCDARCEGCGLPINTDTDACAVDNAGWTYCPDCAPAELLAPGDPEAVEDR